MKSANFNSLCCTSLIFIMILLFSGCYKGNEIEFVQSESSVYEIIKGNSVVGGVNRYDLPEYGEIHWGIVLRDLGIFDWKENSDEYWMIEGSLYGDRSLSHGTEERELHHEFFLFDDHLYEIWVEDSMLTPEEHTKILTEFTENLLPNLS